MDNMAATPIDPRVVERHGLAMLSAPGNANSSEHAAGVQAKRELDEAAEALLHTLGSDAADVTFTPGASPALWLAIEDTIARAGKRLPRIAATAVEHPALLSSLHRAERDGRVHLTVLPVDGVGAPQVEAIERALNNGVDLLCTMAVNNEVGTVTDLEAIGELVSRSGARHLIDASQAAGRINMKHVVAADLVVVSGAKLYGPRRAGALIGTLATSSAALAHDVFGSPDVPSAAALAFAAQLRVEESGDDEARLLLMRDALQAHLLDALKGLRINGSPSQRLAGSLHVSTPHVPGDVAVSRLWGRVAVSTGAACQSGVPGPSHVLMAMGLSDWAREGAVRIGLGKMNTEQEVEEAGALIAAALSSAESVRRYA
ncbi:cysteine desulfurase family protein [Sphingobium sp. GW456-12-10-14-TSB1]|uniref:cysteine desulfurase family protein n=1 Tax=Sphingobium sp. GW456-12-10-14-TSB1 TaxID=1987165 RepID=UPI0020CE0B63|nr:aminotransferase class V-fold PLP-dependent enzyme [Sphingobium sp. GW456-12-10-14-TSB1]